MNLEIKNRKKIEKFKVEKTRDHEIKNTKFQKLKKNFDKSQKSTSEKPKY